MENESPMGFNSIRTLVESQYPMPIATVFRKARVTPKADIGGCHKNMMDLFEVFIKYLCIVSLQEARMAIPRLKELLPGKEKSLEFLKHPSLGAWVGLLRILSAIDTESANMTWHSRIKEWYGARINSHNQEILQLLSEVEDIRFERRTKTPNAEICNALVTYRNKAIGHGANLHEEELARRLKILERVLSYLLMSTNFMAEMLVFQVEEIQIQRNNQFQVKARLLNGLQSEPESFTSDWQPDQGELYLTRAIKDKLETAPVSLCPFLLWQVNEDLKQSEIYFFNDAWRTKLEYLSYASGSRYYHKELHSGFSDLITLKIHPGAEEDPYRDLSPEERATRAEGYYKRAMLLQAQGQYEEALEVLENSAELERLPRTFLQMAKIQQILGDPKASIQQSLQNALDLDPNHKNAITMRHNLNDIINGNSELSTSDVHVSPKHSKSILHNLTPKVFGRYATLYWIAISLFWYTFSSLLEYFFVGDQSFLAMPLLLGATVSLITGVTVGGAVIQRIRLPLSLQLDSMRLDRFNEWFSKQSHLIFGNYVYYGGKIKWYESLKREKYYWMGMIGFTIFAVAAAIVYSGSYKLPILLIIKRIIDFSFIYTILIPSVRYVFASTIFVFRFSSFSLKPMLTQLNDDGFRAFGPFLAFNVSCASIAFALHWMAASILQDFPYPIDIPFLVAFSFIFMVWSVGMPLAIRRAAKNAKGKTVRLYSEHIENALKDFLEQPDEEGLQRYKWLLKNQKVIQKIPTWPLSLPETFLAVIFPNLLLVTVDAYFIIVTLGYGPEVWSRIGEWLLLLRQ